MACVREQKSHFYYLLTLKASLKITKLNGGAALTPWIASFLLEPKNDFTHLNIEINFQLKCTSVIQEEKSKYWSWGM